MNNSAQTKNNLLVKFSLLRISLIVVLTIISIAIAYKHYPSFEQQKIVQPPVKYRPLTNQINTSKKPQKDDKNIIVEFTQQYAKPLSSASIFLGCGGILGSIIVFIIIQQLETQAKRSPAEIYKNYMKRWRTLRWITFLSSIMFILSFSLSLSIAIPSYGAIIMIAIFMILCCLTCYQFIHPKLPQYEAMELFGKNIVTSHHQHLWPLILEIAQKLQVTPPDHIILGIENDCFITKQPILLLEQQTKLTDVTLHLSYDLMNYPMLLIMS